MSRITVKFLSDLLLQVPSEAAKSPNPQVGLAYALTLVIKPTEAWSLKASSAASKAIDLARPGCRLRTFFEIRSSNYELIIGNIIMITEVLVGLNTIEVIRI